MGTYASYHRYVDERDIAMDPDEPPTFDKNLGFTKPRQKRVMIATEEEMSAAKIPLDKRDYCAHLFLKIEECRADNFPWVHRCHHQVHAYEQCEFEDYVLRMKEYERERRLRKLALKEKAQAAAA